MTVRVRFAPSPTGHLHIGGLRSALFNWLYARHNNGVFLLRIEDTDLERSKQEYTDSILSSFEWLNLQPDEPIVIQSERIAEHQRVLEKLLLEKKAYRCFCSQEEVVARHEQKYGNDAFIKYDGLCRSREVTVADLETPHAIRFALPEFQEITVDDMIRGQVTFPRDQFDDFIIARSDGTPMYNFVVVIDDAFMRISHIIRGEEHLVNTPKQILLYQACGYSVPQFAHLPLILGPSGEKLSKRDAATSVMEYRTMGYMPEALLNYLVRLGWSHGDQEIFSRQELINFFSLDQVGKKGSIFDMTKLAWVNSVYIKAAAPEDLWHRITHDVAPSTATHMTSFANEQIYVLVDLYKERVDTLAQLADSLVAVAAAPKAYVEQDFVEWTSPETANYLVKLIDQLAILDTFTEETTKSIVKALAQSCGVKLVQVAQPVRIALIGTSAGPGVFPLLAVLGKDESIARLQAFKEALQERYR